MSREVIYSPGYGAGWWTWYSGPISFEDFCCHPILVKAVQDGKFSEMREHKDIIQVPEFKEWYSLMQSKYQLDENHDIYAAGLFNAIVKTVSGRIRIEEYDGSEFIEYEHEAEFY